MAAVPTFDPDGLLPPGDYEVSLEELRRSILVSGPGDPNAYPSWDKPWRDLLVRNFEILTNQLWQVGIREIFADGSFAEDKEHPNDIDGYFVCALKELISGELERQLNLLDPIESVDLGPGLAKALPRISQEAASHVAQVPRGIVSACTGSGHRLRHLR